MGATSLPAAAPRRRSFILPSFIKKPSAAERQEVLKTADDLMAKNKSVEEAARIQKAAAWQWYTRGVGEALLAPTRPAGRPPVRNLRASASYDQNCIDGSCAGKANVCTSSNMSQKETMEPPLAESHRAASRFKAEASGGAPPTLPAPSGGPSTPLYDELELSSLHTHMADFVQRLQRQDTPDNEQSSTAVGVNHGKSRPPPPSVSNDLHHTRGAAGVELPVVSAGDRHQQLPTLLSPSASVASSASIPLHMKPFSALQKLFRKVLSGSVPKCTNNIPQIIDVSAPAVYEPTEELSDDVDSTNQYHHHHYIHHHHHHYHFSGIPEEQSSTILRRRRHSESGSSRLSTPNLAESGSDEEEVEDEAEESRRFAAYLARRRRRRHSDTFSKYQLLPESAGSDKDEGMKEESRMQFPRRYNSERFSASKIPTIVGKDSLAKPVDDEFDEGTFASIIRGRRRHSAELQREKPSLERTVGKSAGGAYVLGGGAGAGGGTLASMPTGRRRHSESAKERPEAGVKYAPSPGRPYWTSPSVRYYEDGQGRHIVVPTPANATTAGLAAGLPPLYPY